MESGDAQSTPRDVNRYLFSLVTERAISQRFLKTGDISSQRVGSTCMGRGVEGWNRPRQKVASFKILAHISGIRSRWG